MCAVLKLWFHNQLISHKLRSAPTRSDPLRFHNPTPHAHIRHVIASTHTPHRPASLTSHPRDNRPLQKYVVLPRQHVAPVSPTHVRSPPAGSAALPPSDSCHSTMRRTFWRSYAPLCAHGKAYERIERTSASSKSGVAPRTRSQWKNPAAATVLVLGDCPFERHPALLNRIQRFGVWSCICGQCNNRLCDQNNQDTG